MRDLWLMRHGRAAGSSPSGDAGRPLTDEGAEGIERVAQFAVTAGWRPDEMWHSPYLRAIQTAERVHRRTGGARSVDEGLVPNGRPSNIADALRLASGSVFVVSHLPLLPAVLDELFGAPAQINISPGTVVHLAMMGRSNAFVRGVYEPDVTEPVGAALAKSATS